MRRYKCWRQVMNDTQDWMRTKKCRSRCGGKEEESRGHRDESFISEAGDRYLAAHRSVVPQSSRTSWPMRLRPEGELAESCTWREEWWGEALNGISTLDRPYLDAQAELQPGTSTVGKGSSSCPSSAICKPNSQGSKACRAVATRAVDLEFSFATRPHSPITKLAALGRTNAGRLARNHGENREN